jgi:hypothetical protein
MTTASATKLIPLISSGTAGPLGAVHLPRLWLKLTLAAHDMLADGYDEAGARVDQMTLDALGLDKVRRIRRQREWRIRFPRRHRQAQCSGTGLRSRRLLRRSGRGA